MPTPTEGGEKPDVPARDGTADAAAIDATEPAAPHRIPIDLVSGVFLLAVVAVAVLNAGEGTLDWIFPLALSYTLAAIAIYLTVRGLLGRGDRTDTLVPVLHGRGIDVLVFTVITAVYVVLVPPIGFWTMSALMLFAASVYLDSERTRKRIALAAGVAVAVCLVAYVLFVRVLFVPLPPEGWLPG